MQRATATRLRASADWGAASERGNENGRGVIPRPSSGGIASCGQNLEWNVTAGAVGKCAFDSFYSVPGAGFRPRRHMGASISSTSTRPEERNHLKTSG